MNYLASPPLVVAYALAGTMDIDLLNDPLGQDADGADVFLRDIWPSDAGDRARPSSTPCSRTCSARATRRSSTATSTGPGSTCRTATATPGSDDSTYVRNPPYFEGMQAEPAPVQDILGARVLAKLGDSVTTDHISPAGAIKKDSPAGHYLMNFGVDRRRARRRTTAAAARRAGVDDARRPRRRPEGLQLLRLAARQPRGDGARHVREHPPAQPARARDRGRRHAAPARAARR